jgi:pimeloyl-ACP methyl ester carboxylesterase
MDTRASLIDVPHYPSQAMLKRFVLLLALACASFFAGASAYGQNHPDHSPLVTGPGGQVGIYGPNGKFIGIDDDPETVLGGSFGNPFALQRQATVIERNIFSITIDANLIPGSDWNEEFLVGIPNTPIHPTPVLVAFHGYGKRPTDVLADSDLFPMGMDRGWIVVAPLGAHEYNYGIEYSQRNVETALTVLATMIAPNFGLTVDADRFYAVGFSMGGGAAASFAARHCDANGGLHFAATAIHTGPTSLSYTYETDKPPYKLQALFNSPKMFGGPPSDPLFAFDYSRCSSMDIDPADLSIDSTTEMLKNLAPTPLISHYVLGVNSAYDELNRQTAMTYVEHANLGGTGTMWVEHGTKHKWRTLAQGPLLQIFGGLSSQAPADAKTFSTLADRDGGWHCFEVSQAVPRVLSPFKWTKDSVSNSVMVTEVANIAELNLPSPIGVGLDTTANLTYHFNTADSVPVKLIIGEYMVEPQTVLRGKDPGNYSFDLGTSELILHEPASDGFVTWRITP